ncbi:MAG: response regulator [Lachnospiraceae bacterium]|nr:response regulator [Lachnospiraceae bacterium]
MNEFYLYANYDAVLMAVIIMLIIKELTMKELIFKKLYFVMDLLVFLIILSDMVYQASKGGAINIGITGNYIANIFYFACSTMAGYVWFIYTRKLNGSKRINKKKYALSFFIPAFIVLIMELTTPVTHLIFYFTPDNHYQRGPLNFVYVACMAFYLLLSVGFSAFYFFRDKTRESFTKLKTVVTFALFPFVAGTFQVLFMGIPAVPTGTMLCALYIYVYTISAERDNLIRYKASTDAKNMFLTSISHEIRTPINAILGMNTMIKREGINPKVKEYAENIESSGNLLLSLVNDILDMSKLNSAKMEIVPVNYEFASMIKNTVGMVLPRAEKKGLKIRLDIDRRIPRILLGDEVSIGQILRNLLTNAVKYTDKGMITLRITFNEVGAETHMVSGYDFQDKTELDVSVMDTGAGIKEEDLERIFLPFERADLERNHEIEGTGLGMSITRSLLRLMGSELNVESTYGEGSTFSFKLLQNVVDRTETGRISIKNMIPEENVSRCGDFVAPNAKVLVVDDTPINLTVFVELLKNTRIKIDTANSGDECLELAGRKKYDVIFLDHMMPGKDGIETYHLLVDGPDSINKETPIIALTADAVAGAREKFIVEGFTNYLPKPIDPEKLERMLENYIPKQLIKYLTDEEKKANESREAEAEKDETIERIKDRTTLEVDDGIKAVGTTELYKRILKDYYETLNVRAQKAKDLLDAGNIKEYTILVHGLKSTSRLAGASRISALSAELEECGLKGDVETIKAKNPTLIDKCKKLFERLTPVFSDMDEKPEIPEVELEEAKASIREAVEVFDLDTADAVMEQLGHYKMPVDFADTYLKLKTLLADVARDEIIDLLGSKTEDKK